MPKRNPFATLSKKVTTLNSINYSDSDLISAGLWNVFAGYASTFSSVLPFRVLLRERKIYLVKCSHLKQTILTLSTTQMIAFPLVTFLLLIKKLLFTRLEASGDMLKTKRILTMFYVIFFLPALLSTSVMISFKGGQICQIVNPIVEFRDRIRGNE